MTVSREGATRADELPLNLFPHSSKLQHRMP